MNQQREQEALLAAQREQELREQEQAAQEKEEPPQNSDFRQLIREMCGTKVYGKQNQNMEDTMLELLEAIKNIVEQAPKHRTRLTKYLKNFKVIHNESSISLNKTPQISLVIAIASVLPTEKPEYSLSMKDEHLSTISETELNEVIKSSIKNLVPIPSESEVTFDNENTLIDSSPKFDYLLEEFSGELAHIDLIPSGIEEADLDLKEETVLLRICCMIIHLHDLLNNLIQKLLIRLSSLSFHLISPLRIVTLIWRRSTYFLQLYFPLPKNESLNFDHHDDPLFLRPPPEPPDVKVFFDFEPATGVLTAKVVEDIFEHYVLMPKLLPSQPTLCLNIDTLLPFSSENEDKVFKPGILSYLLLSHWDKFISDFSENPMMMYEGDIPLLDVPYLHFYPP
nr:hypothetical protein [Tanacetum cinerariifolium]